MDTLIQFIQHLIQAIVAAIQPLIDNGNLGYLMPFILLIAATLMALTARNRLALAGYILGWIIAIALISLYLETNGDNLLANVTGNVPRTDVLMPIFWGFVAGFLFLAPFLRRRWVDMQPLIAAFVTAFAIVLLFLAYRASVSITVIQSAGVENLIVYRKRFVGIFALAFGIGVLLHVVISASNPPQPPPYIPPPREPRY